MKRYFAKLSETDVVLDIIVAEDLLWCMQTYGGRWEEVVTGHSVQRFPRKGMTFVHDDPRRFVRQEEL